uniref:LRRCT domain-containing protein n=1 Tax=Bracon brevicornis TaxID=1563983 RepID=A0A6V7IM97_9HYME
MKFLIALIVISLTLSTLAEDPLCFLDNDKFTVCIESGRLAKVTGRRSEKSYTMRVNSNLTIGSGAFERTSLRFLHLRFGEADSLRLNDLELILLPNSFDGMDELAELEVYNAQINYTGKPLEYLKNLETLTWSSSRLEKVPTELLEGAPNLKNLEIVNNQITVLRANDFAPLRELNKLDLRITQLGKLDAGCFDGLDELTLLDLSYCQLTHLPDVFSNLKNLKELNLRDCDIATIEPNALQGMPALQELNLVGNQLRDIPIGTFDQLPGLRLLLLDRNYWINVKRGLFNNIPSLERLSMEDLQMGSIEPGAFSGMNISVMDLQACDVVVPGAFEGLVVDEMKLAGWHYDRVPKNFKGLTSRVLDLSSNSIKSIKSDDFAGVTTEIINLHWNSIKEIAPGAFKNTTVSKIILTKNPIKDVNKTLIGVPESVVIEEDYLEKKWYEDDDD